MKVLALIYIDTKALKDLPPGQADAFMKECVGYDQELRARGTLIDAQVLVPPQQAVTLRQRAGKLSTIDGPFAETKEILGGFQLWETRDLAEAVELARHIPWTRVGSVEVRAIGAFGVVPEFQD
jgi:hypothetical protein